MSVGGKDKLERREREREREREIGGKLGSIGTDMLKPPALIISFSFHFPRGPLGHHHNPDVNRNRVLRLCRFNLPVLPSFTATTALSALVAQPQPPPGKHQTNSAHFPSTLENATRKPQRRVLARNPRRPWQGRTQPHCTRPRQNLHRKRRRSSTNTDNFLSSGRSHVRSSNGPQRSCKQTTHLRSCSTAH